MYTKFVNAASKHCMIINVAVVVQCLRPLVDICHLANPLNRPEPQTIT